MAGNTPQRNYPFFSGPIIQKIIPVVIATASAVTYTPDQIFSGEIRRDPNGAGRTDTLPTAAALVAAKSGFEVGSAMEFLIRNDAGSALTITVAAGTGGTTSGTMTIAQSNMKKFRLRFTAVDPGTEAYELSSLGTTVF